MFNRNTQCTACDLYQTCRNVCMPPVAGKTPRVMVVLESPSVYEDNRGESVTDDNHELIIQTFRDALEVNMDEVYITYLVKCTPLGGIATTPENKTACVDNFLLEEIREIKPRVILAVGGVVSQFLTGSEAKITDLRKEVRTLREDYVTHEPIPVVCTYSPNYAKRHELNLVDFGSDLHRAIHTATDTPYTPQRKTQWVLINTVGELKELVKWVKQAGVMSFDFESTGLDWFRYGEDVSENNSVPFLATVIAITFQAGVGYVIPLDHPERPETLPDAVTVMGYLSRHLLDNPAVRLIGHNVKFDMHIARMYGAGNFAGRVDDTMVMSHIIDETRKHGLKDLTAVYYPEFVGYEADVKKTSWASQKLDTLAQYAATDADLTYRLAVQLEAELQDDPRLYKLYRNLQAPFIKPAFEAEHEGMLIDLDAINRYIDEAGGMIEAVTADLRENHIVKKFCNIERTRLADKLLAELKTKIDQANVRSRVRWEKDRDDRAEKFAAGALKGKALERYMQEKDRPFTYVPTDTEAKVIARYNDLKTGVTSVGYEGINFDSVPQIKNLLYTPDGFGFKVLGSDKFTARETLMELPDTTGFIEKLLLLRSLQKTTATFLVGVRDRLDVNNRIHTSFKQHGTVSGRLSSSDPNLQNLPNPGRVKNEEAKRLVAYVKKSFTVPTGYTLVQIDYSQAELRIIAEFANEERMIEAYANDEDLHAVTGANIAGIKTLEEFYTLSKDKQKDLRTKAKSRNFGLIYGMGAEGYKEYAHTNYGVDMTLKEAEKGRNAFFSLYPGLLKYHATYIAKAQKFGYVRTLFGRKRQTPNINSRDRYIKSMDERVAINSPIQGTAGELTIFTIALLHLRCGGRDKVRFVNTVHDSIMFYVRNDVVHTAVAVIKNTAENLPTVPYFDRELVKVTMKVDVECSQRSWGELEPYDPEKDYTRIDTDLPAGAFYLYP